MSAKTKRIAAAGAAARVQASQLQRQKRTRPRWHKARPTRWVPIVIGLVALVGALALLLSGSLSAPSGKVSASSTSYDFGQVPMKGGNITTKFPLSVDGEALVTDITST